jgi:uncharacterized protein YicC (UPF0701 family)
MSKSVLTIHKEIEKAAYAKSPLGQIEKKLNKFYQEMKHSGKKLPEDISHKIFDIRDAHEKAQMEYIERTNREHREAVDAMLLEAMTKEFALISEYQSTAETK